MNNEKYLKHAAGLYSLLSWLNKNQENGIPYTMQNQVIKIGILASRDFSIGISKNKIKKVSKTPFLACQSKESEWISLISWKSVITREHDLSIYIISEHVEGDGNEYPDLPPFALALDFDHYDKISLVRGFQYLEAREYYMNDLDELKINFHKALFKLFIINLPEEANIFDKSIFEKIESYDNLLNKKIQKHNMKYDNYVPDYVGEQYKSELHDKLKALLKK